MAPKVQLMYFDIRARAEIVRIMLNYGGIEFEDKRVQNADWPKVKPSMLCQPKTIGSSAMNNMIDIFQQPSLGSCLS